MQESSKPGMLMMLRLVGHFKISENGAWDRLAQLGPDYGYYPNAEKTWLIVKEDYLEEAKAKFNGSRVSITAEGKRHLGAAVGILYPDMSNAK